MQNMDLDAIEQTVTQSIAANPRAAYLLLIAVAQAWGQCLQDLDADLGDLDENNAAMDATFAFVPEPIRTAVKTYIFIGHQMAAGALPNSANENQ